MGSSQSNSKKNFQQIQPILGGNRGRGAKPRSITLVSKTSAHKGTVYLIHGLWSSGSTWTTQANELRELGYDVVVIEYKSVAPYLDYPAINSSLQHEMKKNGHTYDSRGVFFIGHSQGGMYLNDNKQIPASKIITINSPGATRGYNFTASGDVLTLGQNLFGSPEGKGRSGRSHGDKPIGQVLDEIMQGSTVRGHMSKTATVFEEKPQQEDNNWAGDLWEKYEDIYMG